MGGGNNTAALQCLDGTRQPIEKRLGGGGGSGGGGGHKGNEVCEKEKRGSQKSKSDQNWQTDEAIIGAALMFGQPVSQSGG